MSLEDDDFIPDYEPAEEDIPTRRITVIKGASKRKERVQTCPVCPGVFTNVRRHVISRHVPWYIAPNTACWTCKIQLTQDGIVQVHTNNIHYLQEGQHSFKEEEHGKLWCHLINGLLQEIANRLNLKNVIELVRYVEKHRLPEMSYNSTSLA